MKYDLIIFDMDGTTLNTLGDIRQGINQMLAEYGYSPRSVEEIRQSIGGGVGNLIRKCVPEGTPNEIYQKILSGYNAYYTEHMNDLTEPYPGVTELLTALKSAGVHLASNSNKVDEGVKFLAEAHFGDMFEITVGERPDMPKKPAPDGALHIMNTLGISPERTLYVGDGDADIITARNAGCDCAWVSWGFRKREELEDLGITYAFDTAEALRDFILG